jgi:ribosome recycling factor
MSRFTVPALLAAFVVAQICCAAPLRAIAFEAKEPMHCPLQKQECQKAKPEDCSGGPQLVSEVPVKKFISPVPLQSIAAVTREPVARAEHVAVTGWWSTPTRTIQLRI